MSRHRVIPLHGASFCMSGAPVHPDHRAHGVQVGGCGGRIIGDGWQLGRAEAERLARELDAAYQAGALNG